MLMDCGEVLLAGGAMGTPQLLLLSRIGPRGYLASWGIPVVHHSPCVGLFMFDNPRNGISIVPPVQLDDSLIQVVGIRESGTNLEEGSNIVLFASPARPVFLSLFTIVTLMEKVVGPVSSRSLILVPTDVRANPVVQFNYLSDAGDLERCMSGTSIIGDVLNIRAMEDFMIHQWFDRRDFMFVGTTLSHDHSHDALMGEFCSWIVTTIWHYLGGCLAGKVVARELKVIEVISLGTIDGSTVSPGTNPQATVLMRGRYFVMKFLKEQMSRMSSM